MQNIYLKISTLTELEKNRTNQFLMELRNIVDFVQTFQKFDSNFKKLRLIQLKDSLEKLQKMSLNEPFNYFPDLDLWLISNNVPIGLSKIKYFDLIWSNNMRERGSVCSKMIYMNIKVII